MALRAGTELDVLCGTASVLQVVVSGSIHRRSVQPLSWLDWLQHDWVTVIYTLV